MSASIRNLLQKNQLCAYITFRDENKSLCSAVERLHLSRGQSWASEALFILSCIPIKVWISNSYGDIDIGQWKVQAPVIWLCRVTALNHQLPLEAEREWESRWCSWPRRSVRFTWHYASAVETRRLPPTWTLDRKPCGRALWETTGCETLPPEG